MSGNQHRGTYWYAYKVPRRRERGRHRGAKGCFPDYYRTVEAFTAAQQVTVELVELLEREERGHIELVQRNHLRMYLPVGPPPGPGDGTITGTLTLLPPEALTEIPALQADLWLPGDRDDLPHGTVVFDTTSRLPARQLHTLVEFAELLGIDLADWHLMGAYVDDDDEAHRERLMGTAGA